MSDQFRLGLRRAFRAEHALIGGDWGAENQRHAHEYLWELRLTAPGLDRHGYLLDLVDLEQVVGGLVRRYQASFLNDLPEFEGLNPSLERFARLLALGVRRELPRLEARIESVLWENSEAWASWSEG